MREYENSKEIYRKAKVSIPGGVNSPVRAFKGVDKEYPVFIKSGKGSKIYDEDNNEYIDYIGSWGPMILGHCDEMVIKSVKDAVELGSSFGLPTFGEIKLAELIKKCVPSIERLRMTSSGTEAVMSAIRLSRAFTGKNKVVKFDGCYHGHSDSMLVKAGSGLLTFGSLDSNGLTDGTVRDTIVAPYNDIEAIENIFSRFMKEIACIIVEPIAANMGLVLPKNGFLEKLRELTTKNGAILIFDEVISGFRVNIGGAQALYDIKPDLTILGKITGGGYPMGIFGGRADIMSQLSPEGNVYQAGTLSGNAISVAAGYATIERLNENTEIYLNIEKKTDKIVRCIIDTAKKYNKNISVNKQGSLFTMFFTKEEVTDLKSSMTSDNNEYAKLFNKLLDEGIMFPPSQYEACFVSDAHSEEDVDRTCKILEKAIGEL